MRSRAVLVLSWVLVVAACTAPNPGYVGPISGGAADGATGGTTDGAVARDGGDAGPASVCATGARACIGQIATAVCTAGRWTAERTCPTGSSCQGGHCGVPTGGAGVGLDCAPSLQPVENLCLASGAAGALSCEPFFSPAPDGSAGGPSLTWRCASPVGTGASGAPCTSGAACRSGVCGSNGTCFRGCLVDADCPSSSGRRPRCAAVQLEVEGTMVRALSCVER